MGLTILFGLFFLGLIVGAPVTFAVGLAAVGAFLYEGLPLFVAFQRILSGISVFSLLAIPFLTGSLPVINAARLGVQTLAPT